MSPMSASSSLMVIRRRAFASDTVTGSEAGGVTSFSENPFTFTRDYVLAVKTAAQVVPSRHSSRANVLPSIVIAAFAVPSLMSPPVGG